MNVRLRNLPYRKTSLEQIDCDGVSVLNYKPYTKSRKVQEALHTSERDPPL